MNRVMITAGFAVVSLLVLAACSNDARPAYTKVQRSTQGDDAVRGVRKRGVLWDDTVPGTSLQTAIGDKQMSVPGVTKDHPVRKAVGMTLDGRRHVAVLFSPDIEYFVTPVAPDYALEDDWTLHNTPKNFTDGRTRLAEIRMIEGKKVLVQFPGTQDLGNQQVNQVAAAVSWISADDRYQVRSRSLSLEQLLEFTTEAIR